MVTCPPIPGRPGWMGEGAVKGEILPVVDDPRRGQARLSFESLDRADLATPLPDPGERFDRPATTLRLQLILAHTTPGAFSSRNGEAFASRRWEAASFRLRTRDSR